MASPVLTPLNMNSNKITNLGAGTNSTDAIAYNQNWNSFLTDISGTLAETYPRQCAGETVSSVSNQVPAVTAIGLYAGTVVSKITYVTGSTAESSAFHGWYGLLDSTGKVLAVTADQGSTISWPANTVVTLSLASSYTVPTSGLYYTCVSINAIGLPTFLGLITSGGQTAARISPVLYGVTGTQAAPPTVGTTLTISNGIIALYSYVS